MKRSSRSEAGFTLVDLYLVVVILGILLAVALPQVLGATSNAESTSVLTNLTNLRQAIEVYTIQHDGNPPTADVVNQLTAKTDKSGAPGLTYGPYMTGGFPKNPFNGRDSVLVSAGLPLLASGLTGWIYDVTTGAIRLNDPGKHSSGRAWYTL